MLKIGNKYKQSRTIDGRLIVTLLEGAELMKKCLLHSLDKLKENDNNTIEKQEIVYCRESSHV